MPFICSAELPNDHAPALSPRTPVLDVSRPLTSAEHEALDELLAQYGRRNPEEEEEEEAAEEKQPDLQKDDMLTRRTGAFQKASSAYNRFLPMPGSRPLPQRESSQNGHAARREGGMEGNRPRTEGYSEWNIKTTRNWIGQRWGGTGLLWMPGGLECQSPTNVCDGG